MGSGFGSAGNPERTATQGRHRHTGAATTWTPPITPIATTGPAHARQPIDPPMSGVLSVPAEEPSRTGPADTGPIGLKSFNLGNVPASVTPPRSWRRAAWFMIFASVAALVGLVCVTTTMVGPRRTADHLSALPNLPTGPELAQLTTTATAPRTSRSRRSDPATARDLADGPPRALTAPGSGTVADGAGSGLVDTSAAGADGPVDTGTGQPAEGGTPVTTVAGSGPPSANPATLAARTQTFFQDVTTDTAAAAQLTAGTVRDDAEALIQQRYGQIAAIQVQSISVDPNSGVTISLLKVVDKDGTTQSQQTTLHFTLGTDPKIQIPGG